MTDEARRSPDHPLGGPSRGGVTSKPHLAPEADRPPAPATFLSTDGCARRAMLSRKVIYRAIESGELLAFRVRARLRVPEQEFRRWMTADPVLSAPSGPLLAPLAQDLAAWRLAQGSPDPESIVFPGESPDGTLTEGQWNRWTQGTFRAAKLAVGLPNARAYDLRHSFVSLLIHEGQSILEVARQAGHSPQTCLRDYGHLFDEFDPATREPAEEIIRAARASSYSLVPSDRHEPARSRS